MATVSNRTTVTVAAGRTLTREVNGTVVTFVAGDTVDVAAYEVAILRQQGVIN